MPRLRDFLPCSVGGKDFGINSSKKQLSRMPIETGVMHSYVRTNTSLPQ